MQVAGPIQDQVDKKHPSKATRQEPLQPGASDLDDESAAQLDLAVESIRQHFVNIAATVWPYNNPT